VCDIFEDVKRGVKFLNRTFDLILFYVNSFSLYLPFVSTCRFTAPNFVKKKRSSYYFSHWCLVAVSKMICHMWTVSVLNLCTNIYMCVCVCVRAVTERLWIYFVVFLLYAIRQCLYALTLYGPVVAIWTASLTFNNSTFCPHSVFICFVWIWEQTAIIPLYSIITWLAFIREILPFKAQWLLYIPPGLTINNSTFYPRSITYVFLWIWKQTAIISLYNIDWFYNRDLTL
jgi:hypothetical protein